MTTLAERLTECFEVTRAKPADLARACGIKQPSINDWMSGRTKNISGENLLLAAQFFNVNPWWLATGKGKKTLVGGATGFGNVDPVDSKSRRVPVISYVQAGMMVEVVDPFSLGDGFDIIEVTIPCSPRTFALRIRGNSMEPRFFDGDIAVIDPEIVPRPGQFVVAKNTSEEATFKKYRPRGMNAAGEEVFELVPLNDDYPTLYSDRDHLHIIGVCIERRENMLR